MPNFVDRNSQFPNRRMIIPVSGQQNTYDIERAEGTITEPGTAWNANTMNNFFPDIVKFTPYICTTGQRNRPLNSPQGTPQTGERYGYFLRVGNLCTLNIFIRNVVIGETVILQGQTKTDFFEISVSPALNNIVIPNIVGAVCSEAFIGDAADTSTTDLKSRRNTLGTIYDTTTDPTTTSISKALPYLNIHPDDTNRANQNYLKLGLLNESLRVQPLTEGQSYAVDITCSITFICTDYVRQ